MERHAVIEFDDIEGEYRVRLSPVPLGQYRAIWDAFPEAFMQYRPDELAPLAEAFAPFFDGDVWALDGRVLLAVIREWIREVRRVPPPLRRRSSDTELSEDQSPTNSPEQSSTTTS